jgi:hypothetical protein
LSPKSNGQSKKFRIHTVAFYNFENLFDTINEPNTFDEDWTPKGSQHWTFDKYQKKLSNLARVLAEIGSANNPESPTFIGGCEIENRGVLEDLIQQPNLADKKYGIIHFDSPDKRGIDVALLYRKNFFSQPHILTSHYMCSKEQQNPRMKQLKTQMILKWSAPKIKECIPETNSWLQDF